MNELPLIGCALSEEQLASRARRASGLRPAVARVRREPDRAEIDFSPDLDTALLLELIEAERECCAFFEFDWDAARTRLTVAVPEPRFRPTLDALLAGVAGPRGRSVTHLT